MLVVMDLDFTLARPIVPIRLLWNYLCNIPPETAKRWHVAAYEAIGRRVWIFEPIPCMVQLAKDLAQAGHPIIVLTGRQMSLKRPTWELVKQRLKLPVQDVILRQDDTPVSQYKLEWLKEAAGVHKELCFFDDSEKTITLVRKQLPRIQTFYVRASSCSCAPCAAEVLLTNSEGGQNVWCERTSATVGRLGRAPHPAGGR